MQNKMFIVPFFLSLASLTGCGGKASEYSAKLDSTVALALSNTKVVDKQDYNTDIFVNDEYKDYCQVPDDLFQVSVGDQVLEKSTGAYTYTVENGVGKFHVASEFVTGNVLIDAQAIGQTINIALEGDDKLYIDKTSAAIGESYHANIHFVNSDDEFTNAVPDNVFVTLIDNGVDKHKYDITKLCDYHKNSDASASISIPAKLDDEVIVTGNITIKAQSYRPTYHVDIGKPDDILEVTLPEKSVYKGNLYNFKISIKSGKESSYQLPSSLDILVNGRHIDTTNYKVDQTTGDVNIFENVIDGNVVISGKALSRTGHNMTYVLGGLYTDAPEYIPDTDKPIAIKFMAEKGHELPSHDCIRVLIGEKKDVNNWLEVSTSESDRAYLKDDTLFINTNESDNNKPITVAARAKDVELLNYYTSKGDWASIDIASNLGYAPYLFNIGEVSAPFVINNSNCQVRILDFNRDKNYNAENTAGITFEFINCFDTSYFSKSGTNLSSTYFMKEIGSKFQSEIYEYLNTTVYNALPFKKYINQVDKWTINGSHAVTETEQKKVTTSNNYLFPLSLDEMNLTKESKGELPNNNKDGKGAYAYYKEDGLSLVKTYQGNPIQYWLRTPNQTNRPQTSIITTKGQALSAGSRSAKYGIAPAFCF